MTFGDELAKLDDLRRRGVLSDDEFALAKARVLGAAEPGHERPTVASLNRLRRSRTDRWLGGVCGGLSDVSGVASWLWRLIFSALVLCAGSGIAAYLLLWIFVPNAPQPEGQRVT